MTETFHRRTGCDGFALMDVMLALMLIALLAALAMPGLVRGTGPATIRVTALQVSALLRDNRNVARTSGHPTLAIVDMGGRRIRSKSSTAVINLPAGVEARTTGISFLANGKSSGGEIVLASDTARLAVTVSPDSGAIHVDAR